VIAVPRRPSFPSGAARVKRILKHTWAHLWFDTGLLALVEWLRGLRPRCRPLAILMYHRIVSPERAGQVLSHPDIMVDAATFRRQLAFLASRYQVISLGDFAAAAQTGTPPPRRAVALTFDDGWEDNYQTAFPALRDAGLPATVFLTAGLIGSREMFWQERVIGRVRRLADRPRLLRDCFERSGLGGLVPLLPVPGGGDLSGEGTAALIDALLEVDEPRVAGLLERLAGAEPAPEPAVSANSFLSWTQVAEMRQGGIAFGSHGTSHRRLDRIPPEQADDEILRAKATLAEHLGGPETELFAYPNGGHTARVVAQLREAGYRAAVTTREGVNTMATDRFRLRRINACEDRFRSPRGRFSRAMLAAYLAGLL